jgi:hypothetical protein
MPIWIVLFVVLFGGMQLFQWAEGLTLPLPFFVAAGVLLAIASNADKRAGLPWRSLELLGWRSVVKPLGTAQPLSTATPVTPAVPAEAAQPQAKRSPELPNLKPTPTPVQAPISFTIPKNNASDQPR